MHEIKFHPKVDKDLGKINKSIRKIIKDKIIPKILSDPYHAGKNLSGKLSGLKSYVFRLSGVEYRIVYDIDEKTNCVFLLMAGPRENIYKRLLRRITG